MLTIMIVLFIVFGIFGLLGMYRAMFKLTLFFFALISFFTPFFWMGVLMLGFTIFTKTKEDTRERDIARRINEYEAQLIREGKLRD